MIVSSLLLWSSVGAAQTSTPTKPLEDALSPQAVAARKAEVQKELKTLQESKLPADQFQRFQAEKKLTAAKAVLGTLLKALMGLEKARQRRSSLLKSVENLPRRLKELQAERRKLQTRGPRHFPKVTMAMRDDHATKQQAAQAEVDKLTPQASADSSRLLSIPKEREQRSAKITQLQNDLLEARSKATGTQGEKATVSTVELIAVQLEQERAEIAALEAERGWVSKRAPLRNALLSIAKLRLQQVQQDLETIQQALAGAIEEKQESLETKADRLEKALAEAEALGEILRLRIELETVAIRQTTAGYQEELNLIDESIGVQQAENTRVKRAIDRLESWVQRQASGEPMAQRLILAFESVNRYRNTYRSTPPQALESQLRKLTQALFALEDRLYEFDRRAKNRVAEVTASLPVDKSQRSATDVTAVRSALEDQQSALSKQQGALTALLQANNKIMALHREHRRLVDYGYGLMRDQMLWLRTDKRFGWLTLQEVGTGFGDIVSRLNDFVWLDLSRLWTRLAGTPSLWVFALVVFLLLPWLAYWATVRLGRFIVSSVGALAEREESPGLLAVLLIVSSSAVWPAYIAFVAWSRGLFLPESFYQSAMALALVRSLYMGALVLWLGLFGRALFQPQGWGQHFWRLPPRLCRFLLNVVTVWSLAALVLLVPHYALLALTKGLGAGASGPILELARLLFFSFLVLSLVLIWVVGQRSGPLMDMVLRRSREQQGFLWNSWPLIHLALLGIVATVIALDALGYRYTAEIILRHGLEAISVLTILRFVLVVVVLHFVDKVVKLTFQVGARYRQRDAASEEEVARSSRVLRNVVRVVLNAAALVFLLQLWGVPFVELLTSPTGATIVGRVLIIGITVGAAIVLIRLSNTLAEQLLRPKTTTEGITREAGRKLRTLTPLVQTILKLSVIFVAMLIVLEQIGVSTGPILASIGILGLAVGFASQSLIKDVINGLFILFEDSISVGDIATLHGIGGQVEKITLRAVTLRGLDGTVHVIPNSAIEVASNMTKGFSRYVLDVRVSLTEDVDKVMDIMRKVDEEMRGEPEFGKDMLFPIELWGVERFEESGLIIRARLNTKPIEQWRIGREFNLRMKKAFEAEGIQMPVPHRMLFWSTPSNRQDNLNTTLEDYAPTMENKESGATRNKT
jgi:small-conductance mechanosensitive channel